MEMFDSDIERVLEALDHGETYRPELAAFNGGNLEPRPRSGKHLTGVQGTLLFLVGGKRVRKEKQLRGHCQCRISENASGSRNRL